MRTSDKFVKRACLLVTHGSRDPRHNTAAEQLRLQVFKHWQESIPIVGTATLELGIEPLHQQILRFVGRLKSSGFDKLQIVPIFLLAGTHVMEDIPQEVALAQRSLPDSFTLELCPYLGSHPGWRDRLLQSMSEFPVDRWIFFAHGSKRATAQAALVQLSQQLGAELAYWSMAPSLVDRVERLIETGNLSIGVLPYLLFPGGITDALQLTCQELKHQFPRLSLKLLPPLDASPELASLIVDLI